MVFSLFQAYFIQKGIKPYYKEKKGRRYKKVDGEYACWSLSKFISQYWKSNAPERKNIEFFIKFRHKIEHRSYPDLHIMNIYGECQALLFNFENVLEEEFGSKYAIDESICMPMQFSKIKCEDREKAMREVMQPYPQELSTFVENFRSSLSTDISSDLSYSYKVFLVPAISNNESTMAVQFVDVTNEDSPEYENLMQCLLKIKTKPIVNAGLLKPGKVVKIVNENLAGRPTMTINDHTKCWRYYKVRPSRASTDQKSCNNEFCYYDEAHGDYLYTNKWVELLIKSWEDEDTKATIKQYK